MPQAPSHYESIFSILITAMYMSNNGQNRTFSSVVCGGSKFTKPLKVVLKRADRLLQRLSLLQSQWESGLI